jgi:hypothetical protein
MTQDRSLHTPASDPVKGTAHRLAKTLERHRAFGMHLETGRTRSATGSGKKQSRQDAGAPRGCQLFRATDEK